LCKLTAVRRGVLNIENGVLSMLAPRIDHYDVSFLDEQFLAAIGRAWISRDEAIREFAHWLGFSRTGSVIEKNRPLPHQDSPPEASPGKQRQATDPKSLIT